MNELDYINCEKKLYNYCIQVNEVGFFNFESSINGSKLLEFDNNIYAYNNYGLFKLISPALKLWQKIHLPIELTDNINFNFIVLKDYLYFYTDLELWKIKKCDNWIDGWIKVTSKNKDINEVIMVKPLALFNQNIYGITYNAKSFKIVKSPNLEHSEMLWELAAPESFNNIEKNKDVAFMTIVNNRLYAATNTLQGDFNNENSYLLDGIEIWESKTGNIDSWIKINTPGFGVKRNINNKTIYVNQLISSFSIFKSANNTTESLILGTSSVFGAEIWIYNGEGINGWSTLFLANNTCNIISEIKSILFFNNEIHIFAVNFN
ncbi:hypothetical protein [Clostridium tarantellae]|uniref:Uncharacterized protein n=1 Tax=Clostridium tarantellae TaxID=39493 RepID=A0A6I1MQC6_9CLOT|nr:hypothetical protein [Clostridium tarantellae]MPQ45000.1 hypothetical protein [Clostridium tarantellae]